MYNFAGFTPGAEIGAREYQLDQGVLDAWIELFPADANGDLMPAGMVAGVTISAYSSILQPRPKGNVHGAQRFEIKKLPKVGDQLTTSLSCLNKELKGARRWVYLKTETRFANGDLAFSGLMTSLLAE